MPGAPDGTRAGRRPRPYWAAWWARVLVGLALAWGIAVVGYVASGGLGGILDGGPCASDSQFAFSLPGDADIRATSTLWPPELRCEATLPSGESRTAVYPPRRTWWIAGLGFAAVVVLPVPLLRLRRNVPDGRDPA